MPYLVEFEKIVIKLIRGEKINRIDEEYLYYFLATYYGANNVITELTINENGVEYFGCAVRDSGKWRVYNLAGSAEGVVIKRGKRFHLYVKVGD